MNPGGGQPRTVSVQLFRNAALERLSTPEQLDQLMQVTQVRGWIALAAVGCLVVATLCWSILGWIPSRVSGRGILITRGGVSSVVSLGAGQVERLLVAAGDKVEAGQVLVEIRDRGLADEVAKARAKLDEMLAIQSSLEREGALSARVRGSTIEQNRASLLAAVRRAEQRRSTLAQRLTAEEQLNGQGFIGRETIDVTRRQIQDASNEVDQLRAELRELLVRARELQEKANQERVADQLTINDQRRALGLLEERLELGARVLAPRTGRVLELRVGAGSLVNPGTPILNLEAAQSGTTAPALEAVVFLPAADGKKVQAGMEALLSPTTVRREEFGFVVGRVRAVAEFPATRQGMLRILGNEVLADAFLQAAGGAALALEIDLYPDPTSPSGYRWTSGRGAPSRLDTGTLVQGEVTVKRERPIALVLPLLRGQR